MAKNTMETDLKLYAVLIKAIEIASAENTPFYQHFISSMYAEMEGLKDKMENGDWQSSGSIAAAFDIDDSDPNSTQPNVSGNVSGNASTNKTFGGATVFADADLMNALGISFDEIDNEDEDGDD